MGYHDGEVGFQKTVEAGDDVLGTFGAELEINAAGQVIMKNALPDSGTNHDTALAHVVAEILGFTTRDHVHVLWGDSDIAPPVIPGMAAEPSRCKARPSFQRRR